MTQLTQKQRKICDEFEAMCRELQAGQIKTISASVSNNYGSVFVHGNYGNCVPDRLTGAGIADRLQSALDLFYAENPSECEMAKRKVAELEADLARAKANMETVCNA